MGHRVYYSTQKSNRIGHDVNEDHFMISEYSFIQDKKIQILVVADGMGGLEEGDRASIHAIEGFLSFLYGEIAKIYMANADKIGYSLKYSVQELGQSMVKAIQAANKSVCQGVSVGKASGSTISAVCLFDDFAVFANVGDSPIYLYKENNKQIQLVSLLQTAAERDVKEGMYERYSNEYYQNDHRIYCSLGQYSTLNAEDVYWSFAGNLQPGDKILMGSDGAFGRILEPELAGFFENCPKEYEEYILGSLFERASRDKDDDQTAILYVIAKEE